MSWIRDGKKQRCKKVIGTAARALLSGALLTLAACSGDSSSGPDANNSLTVTPGSFLRVPVSGPGRISFTVTGIDMDLDRDNQPIVYFYDSNGYTGGRGGAGFNGDLRNYKLKVFEVNGALMGDESEAYGYEWRSEDSVSVTLEWTSTAITATVGGIVAVKNGAVPGSFTIGVGYPPEIRSGWDGAVYTDIDWP